MQTFEDATELQIETVKLEFSESETWKLLKLAIFQFMCAMMC